MRQLQQPVSQAELVQDLHVRGVQRVAAEVAVEVAVGFQQHHRMRWRASSRASVAPACPTPTTQQVVCRTVRSSRGWCARLPARGGCG